MLTSDECREAVRQGLNEAQAAEAKAHGLTMAEMRMAVGLGLSAEQYSQGKQKVGSPEWEDAEQRGVLGKMAASAQGTQAGAKLAALAENGVPEPPPVAWWNSDMMRKAAYVRAEAKGGMDAIRALDAAEDANRQRIRQGLVPNVAIPEQCR